MENSLNCFKSFKDDEKQYLCEVLVRFEMPLVPTKEIDDNYPFEVCQTLYTKSCITPFHIHFLVISILYLQHIKVHTM